MSDSAMVYLDAHGLPRAQVLHNALCAASGLDALGVQESECVALLLRNDFSFVEAQQAAAAIGAYAVPINWHGTPDEVLYILQDAQPSVLIAHADLLAPLRGRLPVGLKLVTVPTPPAIVEAFGVDPALTQAAAGELSWPTWRDSFKPWDQPARRSRATMIYTSGTTGRPKAVQRQAATPEQAQAYVKIMQEVYGTVPGIRALVTGPMYHSSPNAFSRQAIQSAELLVMQSKFDPEATLALIEKHRITHAVMVPTMFVRLLKLPKDVRERYDVSSLRWVTHTAAPCPLEVKRAMMDWWGPVIYETYGGSEVGTATVSTPQDWLKHPGSVGVPTAGTRVAFYDEAGQPLADGEIGEIYMRVPAYADFSYLNNPAKRSEVERDGLISCGDIGYLKDGRLYICDRRSDMILSAGVNIYPAEIEMNLLECPGVSDCAVFGIPDEEFGESVMAAVERMPGDAVSAESIRHFLGQRLARYKVPRHIEFHARLPREDSGKIFKRKLRDLHWQQAGRKI
ncbi:acyl-CoA synthetase [Hydrogenophaga sp.]|uniref:acyl-CoA synthetase n=1 Tax=Hydrogenophaga sp. TaxID=1904254 RepID=UPI00271D57CA|nr:acyl-CoA synthetase [Hydrogenophaga sp.]MDO9439065.1 acyl-CoA synthetase [Hydrogenophaga sp.]